MKETILYIDKAIASLQGNKFVNIRNYLNNAKRELIRITQVKPAIPENTDLKRKAKEVEMGVLTNPMESLKIIEQLLGEEKKKLQEIYDKRKALNDVTDEGPKTLND